MSLLFSFISFCVQLIAIASVISIIISSVCPSSTDSALIGEDHPTGAVVSVDEDDSDATLPYATSHCAKSMVSASYTTTIDEPVSIAEDLGSLTIRQLKALCRERGIKHYSYLRKAELIALLSEF